MAAKNKKDKDFLVAARLNKRQLERLRKLSDAIGSEGNISAAIRYAAQKVYIPAKSEVATESQKAIP